MIILGIDPGTVIAGYGAISSEGNRLKMIDSGPIRLKARGEVPNRLAFLADTLDGLIDKIRPSVVSVEKVFHGANFKSALTLGYARGVVLMSAARHGLPIAEYTATEVKKTVTGYGRAEKSQIQEMVRLLLGLPEVPKPADVADALALAICHAHTSPVMSRYSR